jgi:hypothetical protein
MVGAAIVTPAANTAWMNLHLQEISHPHSIRAGPVQVGAGWHELEVPNNVVLLPSPAAGYRHGKAEYVREAPLIRPAPDAGHP